MFYETAILYMQFIPIAQLQVASYIYAVNSEDWVQIVTSCTGICL